MTPKYKRRLTAAARNWKLWLRRKKHECFGVANRRQALLFLKKSLAGREAKKFLVLDGVGTAVARARRTEVFLLRGRPGFFVHKKEVLTLVDLH
jgi:hypothetical protein